MGKKGVKPKNWDSLYTPEINKKRKETLKKVGSGKWLKGIPKTENHRKKISISLGGDGTLWRAKRKLNQNHFGKGHYKKSEEQKKKIKESSIGKNKGKIPWNKGKKGLNACSEETRKKIREAKIKNPNKKFKDTSIELKIEIELQRRNINYQKQVPLCKIAIVDFYLPEYRIVIQCDGDYWHNLSGYKERDENQDRVLTFNGFNVYRFWEHQIDKSAKECIDKLF